MYDIIGDIHGHAAELKQLLHELGYRERNGAWQHPGRQVIFLGDYIDRGPAIRETMHIVKNMVDTKKAIALLGNHEYNAMAYHYVLPDGGYLREHNKKNEEQHKETLRQFEQHPGEWNYFLNWFYTLPLFIDRSEFRAVHACWDDSYIQWLKDRGHSTMSEDLLRASYDKRNLEYNIIDAILKGKEVDIPEEFVWIDKGGAPRTRNRVKWWKNAGEVAQGDFLFNCPEAFRFHPAQTDIDYVVYPKDAPPVFFGHYWLDGPLLLQEINVACLDYSIAKDGDLVSYRFNGERVLDEKNFHSVKSYSNTPIL